MGAEQEGDDGVAALVAGLEAAGEEGEGVALERHAHGLAEPGEVLAPGPGLEGVLGGGEEERGAGPQGPGEPLRRVLVGRDGGVAAVAEVGEGGVGRLGARRAAGRVGEGLEVGVGGERGGRHEVVHPGVVLLRAGRGQAEPDESGALGLGEHGGRLGLAEVEPPP
jgi:hypothetical protein